MMTQICLMLLALGFFVRFYEKRPFFSGLALLFSALVMLPIYRTLGAESTTLSYWLTAFLGEVSFLTLILGAKFGLNIPTTRSQKLSFWCFIFTLSTLIQLAVVGILPAWLWMNNAFLAVVMFMFLMISLWKNHYMNLILLMLVIFIWQINIKQQPLLSLYLTDLWLWLFSVSMLIYFIVVRIKERAY